MSRPEGLLVVVFLHFASQRLLWVFNIVREWSQCFVVAHARRVRWLEWLVMLHLWWFLLRRFPCWNENIFSNDVLVCVKQVIIGRLHLLREGFLLHECLACKTFLLCNFLRSVEFTLDVRHDSTE